MGLENNTEFMTEEKVNTRFEKLEAKVETLTESNQKILSTLDILLERIGVPKTVDEGPQASAPETPDNVPEMALDSLTQVTNPVRKTLG